MSAHILPYFYVHWAFMVLRGLSVRMVKSIETLWHNVLARLTSKVSHSWVDLWEALRVVVLRIIATTCFGFMGASAAFSQNNDLEMIINTLERLDKDVAGIQKRLVGREPTSADAGWSPANHETRLSGLEEELRVLTGEIEEARYELARRIEVLDSLTGKLQKSLGTIEERLLSVQPRETVTERQTPAIALETKSKRSVLSAAKPVVPELVARDPNLEVYDSMEVLGEITSQETADSDVTLPREVISNAEGTAVSVPQLSAEETYAAAYALLLKKRDYVSAEQALRAFIQDYPDHKLAGNAYYWLGETFYVRNNYEGAAKAFAKGYKNFPEGTKAPDNLLKLGLSFRGMGQDESACHVFRKLTENYPDAPAVIVTRVEQEQAEAACS